MTYALTPRLNLSGGFRQTWETVDILQDADSLLANVQPAPSLNISALAGNVNRAIIKGVEVDAALRVMPWLELGGAFTHTAPQYTDPRASVAGTSFVFGSYGDTPRRLVPPLSAPTRNLTQTRAEWNGILSSRFNLAAYVNNLTDRPDYVGGFPLGAVVGGNSVIVGTPRMYGLEVGVEF